AAEIGRPAPGREGATLMKRPVRRPSAGPIAKTIWAGSQKKATRARARAEARRELPTMPRVLRPRAATRARPTTLRGPREAARKPRREDPTPAAHLRALPRTEAARPRRQARLPPKAREAAARRRGGVEAER